MNRSRRDQLRAARPFTRRMDNLPEQETVTDLPSWVHGLSYRADDDTITLRVRDEDGGYTPREMTSEEAIALTGALLRLVDASKQNRAIIDIDPNPLATDD